MIVCAAAKASFAGAAPAAAGTASASVEIPAAASSVNLHPRNLETIHSPPIRMPRAYLARGPEARGSADGPGLTAHRLDLAGYASATTTWTRCTSLLA